VRKKGEHLNVEFISLSYGGIVGRPKEKRAFSSTREVAGSKIFGGGKRVRLRGSPKIKDGISQRVTQGLEI